MAQTLKQQVMTWQLAVGVALAVLCLILAVGHLIWFMWQVDSTNRTCSNIIERMGEPASGGKVPGAAVIRFGMSSSIELSQVSLASVGIMVGLAFGFLGFALFIMNITGAAKLTGGVEGTWSGSIENAAPGLVVLVVAAFLIGVCISVPIAVPQLPPTVAQPAAASKASLDSGMRATAE